MEITFSNFNEEGIRYASKFWDNYPPTSDFASLHRLILTGIDLCGERHANTITETLSERICQRRLLSGDELRVLGVKINELAKIGFEHRDEGFFFFDVSLESLELTPFSLADWAIYGRDFSPASGAQITIPQIYGFSALRLIDDAITSAIDGSITFNFVEAIALAATQLIWAHDHERCESIVAVRGSTATEMESQFKERKKMAAVERAKLRYAKDPKQADKLTVFACWKAWQVNPTDYEGKADFARDMLDQFPNLTSQPVIERWCREWELNAKTITLQAQ